MIVYIVTGQKEAEDDNNILGVYENKIIAKIAQRDFDQKYFYTELDGYEVE